MPLLCGLLPPDAPTLVPVFTGVVGFADGGLGEGDMLACGAVV